MADLNKNGIEDSLESKTPLADQQKLQGLGGVEALINSIRGINSGSNNKSSGTSTSTKIMKLTPNVARALMEATAESIDFMGKFTNADVQAFIKAFDAEQKRQVEKVVTSTSQNTVPGITEDAASKSTESTARTEFPSFFDPKTFASDWVWSKVNFKNEATLGTKSVTALAQVRSVIESFQLLGVSDAEAKAAAKQVAMGKKTIAEYTTDLQKVAMREYPQFADRFKLDPTLTTYDIASPVINMVADTLELDPKSVKMNHPIVLAYTRYAGADGKGQQPSYYDLLLKTKGLPEYQATQAANNEARDSATSLGRALGYGV